MEERLKSGTSINHLLPSELDITINPLTSRTQVKPTTCKSGAPTLDGSRYSSMRRVNSSIGLMERSLMLQETRMLKVKQLE
jgi:hypothetical protein